MLCFEKKAYNYYAFFPTHSHCQWTLPKSCTTEDGDSDGGHDDENDDDDCNGDSIVVDDDIHCWC